MGFIKRLLTPIAEIFVAKLDLKKTQITAEAQILQTAAQNTADWEKIAGQNAANSYLDELWTGVLLVPLVLSFAGYDDMVTEGFKSLENMPEWYAWAVMASVGWAFARKSVPALGSGFKRVGK